MQRFNLPQLQELSRKVSLQRYSAIQKIVFLEDLIENEDRWDIYRDSQSGEVIDMFISGIEDSLLLWCARNWETGTEQQSIERVIHLIQAIEPDVEKLNLDWGSDLNLGGIEANWRADLDYIFQFSLSNAQKVNLNEVRVLRTERHAHSLCSSRDRKKLFPNGFKTNATKYDLLELAKLSIGLIDKSEYVLCRRLRSFEDTATKFRDTCDTFWAALPVFRISEQNLSP